MTQGSYCWDDVIPEADLKATRDFFGDREKALGEHSALLLIDLYNKVYAGGPGAISDVTREHPGACGAYAWDAIPPTVALIAAARAAGFPVVYSTSRAKKAVIATRRERKESELSDDFGCEIKQDFSPWPEDLVILKDRASAFFGTPLADCLKRKAIQSIIICGESTSGCVRASAVDAFSHGFDVFLVEDCCFDRSQISHRVALFDMHHKYAQVIKSGEIIEWIGTLSTPVRAAGSHHHKQK